MVPPLFTERDGARDAPSDKYTPEARREAILAGGHVRSFRTLLGSDSRFFEVIRRVALGCYHDGTIHAGNLAYMSVLAIFPFFITGAAIFTMIGEEASQAATIETIIAPLPPMVANVIEPVARNVIDARSGWLLWIGGAIGLWTVGSLIETLRDILRRAYGTKANGSFWKYRIGSAGIIIGAVLMLFLSLFAQVTITAAQDAISSYFPELSHALGELAWSRIATALGLYGSIWMLFVALTPPQYRGRRYPKWPGALLVTVWWMLVTTAMPPILRSIFAYGLTYGSLAGVMIVLFFFWLVGLGMVAGAELNAALAETPEEERDRLGQRGGTQEASEEKQA